MSNLRKITLNLIPRASDALDRGTKQAGVTTTDFVNRAILLYEWWLLEEAAGHTHLLRRGGDIEQVKVF